jgi:hypothetical protein
MIEGQEVLVARLDAVEHETKALSDALDTVAQEGKEAVALWTIRNAAHDVVVQTYAEIGEVERIVDSEGGHGSVEIEARLEALARGVEDFYVLVRRETQVSEGRRLRADEWRNSLWGFQDRAERHRHQLYALRQEMSDSAVTDAAGIGSWHTFTVLENEHRVLLNDAFSLLAGASTRRMQVDQGVFEVADGLLRDLSRQVPHVSQATAIVAEGEIYLERTPAVTLRFADTSVWGLPAAAHEFGHLVARESRDVERLLLDQSPSGADEFGLEFRYRNELFADVFAAYTLGPAYACTCVLLRFDPTTAYEEGPQHPSAATRVHAITRALGHAAEGLATLGDQVLQRIAGIWPYEIDELDLKKLNNIVDAQLEILERDVGVRRRPSSHPGLVEALMSDQFEPHELRYERFNYGSVIDLLNAAWESRLQAGLGDAKRASEISERVISISQAWEESQRSQRRPGRSR